MAKTKEQPEKLNLYQKLHKIQESVMGLAKDKKAFNYDYVTGTKVLEHVKPLMNEHGLLLKQEILGIENTRQDYILIDKYKVEKAKSEILSKVDMRFTWIDIDTGDKDENLFGANGQNDWDKGVGSALTYAERYFLLKYFHIATDEDDIDNPARDENKKDTKPVPPTQPTTQAPELKWLSTETPVQWTWAITKLKEGVTIDKIKEHFKIRPEHETQLLAESKK